MRIFAVVAALLVCAHGSFAQQADPAELFHGAEQAQQGGDNATAIRKYKELLRLHPEIVAAHANLGVALAAVERYDEAIEQYQFALAEAPGSSPLMLDLGLAYYRKGNFAGAAAQFASLHQNDPKNLRVTILLGECEVQMGLAGQALARLEPLEKDNSEDLDLEWAIGTALIRSGHTLDGLQRVQKVADKGNNPDAYQLAAGLYLGLALFDDAKRDAEALLRLRPNSGEAYTILGMVADYAGDPKTGSDNYSKAIEINPNNLQARLQLANALVEQKNYTAAREHLNRLLASNPHSSGAHYQLAKIAEGEGNLTAAVKDLEAAEQEEPQWLTPHIELSALYYRLKRTEDGAREKAIVDRLREQEQKRRGDSKTISPQVPPQ